MEGSFREFSPFGDRIAAVWNLLFLKNRGPIRVVPVSNSGFELAMLFSDMHWQTHL